MNRTGWIIATGLLYPLLAACAAFAPLPAPTASPTPPPDVRLISADAHSGWDQVQGTVTVRNYGGTLVEAVNLIVECYGELDEGTGEHLLTGTWAGPAIPTDLLPGDFANADYLIQWTGEEAFYDAYVYGGFSCGYRHSGLEVRILVGDQELAVSEAQP
jgi:hypothetical protein